MVNFSLLFSFLNPLISYYIYIISYINNIVKHYF
nr:MAG TPA: hypothetical protein [Caudoviricetes sp.]